MSLQPAAPLRPPDPQLPTLDSRDLVAIFHPLQNSQGAPILRFPAFPINPDPDGDNCNCSPHQHVADESADPDALLVAGYYQLVVVAEGGHLVYDYDVCSSFDGWVPPADIPVRWRGQEAPLSHSGPAIKACIVTGATSCLTESRLVPRSAVQWSAHYYLLIKTCYGGDTAEDLDSARNVIPLRTDLHLAWNHGLFVFVPYAGRIVPVVLDDTSAGHGELAYKYHLRDIAFPDQVLRGYLFVRFAWDILKFHASGLPDFVKIRMPPATRVADLKRSNFGMDREGEKAKRVAGWAKGGNWSWSHISDGE
ncbi:hypothetical protein FB45DRAFT_1039391 [Roridomyces roridus]|uniref:HNH nuclease domain-containing protein n=1 Tax=Roridomyces roridus TaxID=1738132 RepID=A0AAD7F8H0_9AGAR|nr:hypothetical protein FB45DRAFT_1039391 [Roridomyces roridus]